MRYTDILSTQRPRHIPLIIRFLPAIYGERQLRIGHGGPAACMDLSNPWVRFPEPYTEDGLLSEHCIGWIIQCVRDAVEETGISMALVLADDDVLYFWPGEVLIAANRAPSGGLWLGQAENADPSSC